MTDDEDAHDEAETEDAGEGDEEKSFRERVEEIRQERADEGEGEEGESLSREEKMEEMMGGGGPGGGMGGGGSPFAQMMGGMMGGGGPGGALGGSPGGRGESDNEELVREIGKVRDELHDIRREIERVADALEE
jgi:hypothetical protein